ncbi:MAG: hypothetical protein HQL06_13720 [Nitrospirae bacterium]|nr:hypothetical protein [Nitrospirota bacterium]
MADQFGLSTQQDIKAGGDGAKANGWNALNMVNASVCDVNITNAGYLTIKLAGSCTFTGATFTGPFVYQNITGDFDIDILLVRGSGNVQALMCRDPNATAGEDWLEIIVDDNGYLWWAETNNSTTTTSATNLGIAPTYFRMTRVGGVFTSYKKSAPGDSWTIVKIYTTRNDFASTIQVGMTYCNTNTTNVVKYDYFQGINSGAFMATAEITLPAPTLSTSTPPVVNGAITLLICPVNGSAIQSGSFVDVALPAPVLSANTPHDAHIDISLPMPLFDTLLTGSNNVSGQIAVPSPQTNGIELTGGVFCWQINLSLTKGMPFNVEAATSAHTEISLGAIRSEGYCLTGSNSRCQVQMSYLNLEGSLFSSHYITLLLKMVRAATSGTLLTGNSITLQQQSPVVRLYADIATGGVSDCIAKVNAPRLLSTSFSNPLAESVLTAPTPHIEGVACRNFWGLDP